MHSGCPEHAVLCEPETEPPPTDPPPERSEGAPLVYCELTPLAPPPPPPPTYCEAAAPEKRSVAEGHAAARPDCGACGCEGEAPSPSVEGGRLPYCDARHVPSVQSVPSDRLETC